MSESVGGAMDYFGGAAEDASAEIFDRFNPFNYRSVVSTVISSLDALEHVHDVDL